MKTNSTIAHVIVNNLGGITTLVQNLLLYKGKDAMEQELIVLDIKGNPVAEAILDKSNHEIAHYFKLNTKSNWYLTYGNLAKILSKNSGVLVTNDQYDLIMLTAFNIPRKVVQLVHDPYNVSLSVKFHQCIDHFIAHSQYVYEELLKELPHRKKDIVHIPYGIPLPPNAERKINADNPLKLLFLGRHDKAKGVFDLHLINEILKTKSIPVNWVIMGKGPETDSLKYQWKDESNVNFITPSSHIELMCEIKNCDVLVFPTKFEGFPVALLEAMSTGCVPVVTDLPGGIKELVEDGLTGYKCSINQNEIFADKIELLHNNRTHLHQMSINSIQKVFANYDVKAQAPKYQNEFLKVFEQQTKPRHHAVTKKIGSRLDQKWMPNFITLGIRSFIK